MHDQLVRYDIPYEPRNDSDYQACGPVKAYGCIDCKVTSSSLLLEDRVLMVSAPAFGQGTDPFQWSKYIGKPVAHWGMPDRWQFPWLVYSGNQAAGLEYSIGKTAASPEEVLASDDNPIGM